MKLRDKLRDINAINWRGKIAILRADFNVPLTNGKITDNARIRASLSTLQHILANGGGVVCLSHLGRPRAGYFDKNLSLKPIADELANLLGRAVIFQSQIPITPPPSNEVWLLENTRMNIGEKECSDKLAARYAQLGDVFVMDAFASAHRAETSTYTLAKMTKDAVGGNTFIAEITALENVMNNPRRPLVAIVGGSKVSTKISALDRLLPLCDSVIVGGGIANTFLAAKGYAIGDSLADLSAQDKVNNWLTSYNTRIILPQDVMVTNAITSNAQPRMLNVTELSAIANDEKIVDVGDLSSAAYTTAIKNAGTIIWNGPVGMFEYPPFANGTRRLARDIAAADAYSLAGGGDTLAAIAKFNVSEKLSYLSTGGGALLEYLAGETLPALEALQLTL